MLRPTNRRSRAALKRIERNESWRTILVALVANVVIAVAKLISGLMSGSTALLAESAHSLADASNEVLLGISLRKYSEGAGFTPGPKLLVRSRMATRDISPDSRFQMRTRLEPSDSNTVAQAKEQ